MREDAHLLFGFGTEQRARARSASSLKISGVGARTALSVLSGLSVAELAQAVTMQETGRLTKIPGIGKKTAERLLLELKDKLGADLTHGGRRASRAAGVVRRPQCAARARLQRQGGGRRGQAAARRRSRVADGIRQALKLLAQGVESDAWRSKATS